jgi:hypothetical protein
MRSEPVGYVGPFATLCSVMAAVACLAVSLQATFAGQLHLWYPWLFVIAAAAFASNLKGDLHPAARSVAAIAQAVCVFEVLGFSIGLLVKAQPGIFGWALVDWRELVLTWAFLTTCTAALVSATVRIPRKKSPSP